MPSLIETSSGADRKLEPERRTLVRRVGKRVPGAWLIYTALRRALWEARSVFHGVRTGPVVSRVGRPETVLGTSHQRPSAMAPAPADSVVHPTDVPLGEAQERARVAHFLASEGAGPRLYDWHELPAGQGTAAFVFSAQEPSDATARLQALAEAGRIVGRRGAPVGAKPFERYCIADTSAGATQLLGAARERLHFGRESKLRGGRYLYQSVPAVGRSGRRDTGRRWQLIESQLCEAGASVEDRLVLDVGCNAGMMLGAALSSGAAFGVGWDLPEVTGPSEQILRALGFSRFELVGASLEDSYRLPDHVPDIATPLLAGSVIFYLAIRHHVGFVAGLGDFGWHSLVYEGGEEETVAEIEGTLAPLRDQCDFEIASAIEYRDGEGRPRPLAILLRR